MGMMHGGMMHGRMMHALAAAQRPMSCSSVHYSDFVVQFNRANITSYKQLELFDLGLV